ncbi:MAG: response regulator [Bryobacterales bacterium]|nr:response regulator [Bryobacterales bacterium]
MQQPPHVLIVDDNRTNLKLTQVLLEAEGFAVRTAGDAESALRTLQEYTPALILMDVQMPGMDGLELTRHLRADPAYVHVPIIALTAYAMKGDAEQALAAGCTAYVSKPVDTRTLPDLLRNHLRLASGQTAAEDPRERLESTVEEAREEFIREGREESRRLLHQLENGGAGEAGEAVQSIAHRWAGLGATLGLPEISREAQSLEETLRSQPSAPASAVRDAAGRLAGLFAEASDPSGATLLWRRLLGKRLGLVGFPETGIGALEAAAGPGLIEIRPLDVRSPAEVDPGVADALVVYLSGSAAEAAWIDPQVLRGSRIPVLLAGPPPLLLRYAGSALLGARGFLMEPWTPEELLARVFVALSPAAAPPPIVKAATASRASRVSNDRPLVVIADDDPVTARLVRGVLEKFHLECEIATDGASALGLIRGRRPALAVLDVNMPGLDGYSVLAAIKRDPVHARTAIVMLTGRGEDTDKMRGFGFGADDYIVKPFSPVEVAARVTRLLPLQ